jgi:hypothetical protein
MRHNFPVYFDDKYPNDMEVWDWLHTKSGIAGFIRNVLRDKMMSEKYHIPQYIQQPIPEEDNFNKVVEDNSDFFECMSSFGEN